MKVKKWKGDKMNNNVPDKMMEIFLGEQDNYLNQHENKYKNNHKAVIFYWEEIRSVIENKSNKDIVKLNEEEKLRLMEEIDKRIKREEDDIYFDYVKRFTNDFQFLRQYPEIANATLRMKRPKFPNSDEYDKAIYDRFYDLREELQRYGHGDEYKAISELLKSEKTTDGDKRILTARLSVINKQLEAMNR